MWSWLGNLAISEETRLYRVSVIDGVAYAQMGAYATNYEWVVTDLRRFEMFLPDMENSFGGDLLLSRISDWGKHSRNYIFHENTRHNVGYIMEKFPDVSEKEAEEIGQAMVPFLTNIFSMNKQSMMMRYHENPGAMEGGCEGCADECACSFTCSCIACEDCEGCMCCCDCE